MKKRLSRLVLCTLFIFYLVVVGDVCYGIGKGHGNLMYVCNDKIHEEKVQLAVEKEFSKALDKSVLWFKNHVPEKRK